MYLCFFVLNQTWMKTTKIAFYDLCNVFILLIYYRIKILVVFSYPNKENGLITISF